MFSRLKTLFPTRTSPVGDDGSVPKRQGDEYLKLDRLDDAAACYRRAVSINPDYVDACVGLGFVLCEQKRYDEAEPHLRHALAIDSRNADAHYILGTIARNRNDDSASIDHFTRALDLKPDLEFAYRDLAAVLLQRRETQEAKELLRRAVAACPESAEFRFYLGNLLADEADHDAAVACYQSALSIQPASAQAHKNLADVLSKRGQLDQAIASYQKALWFAPDFFDAHVNLGRVMRSQGGLDQAVACYERAVALQPENALVRISLGNVLESQGKVGEAIECYRRAVALDPKSVPGHQFLGNALVATGASEEAVACYEQVVNLDPENPVKHLVAALSKSQSERAPSEYVERLFDEYAHQFDSHLVQVLSYSVPESLAGLLRPHFDPAAGKWNILDLGCGTGLSGAAMAPHARQIVGVDLSAKMLEKARERNLYARLEHMDLLTMMRREADASFDIVVAADVFVYLGKLDELVNQAQRLLRRGGLFAFSVESLEALSTDADAATDLRDYQLNITGRYAHSIAYLSRLAAQDGFEVLATTGTQSRLDKGRPVQGYLALWRRPAA